MKICSIEIETDLGRRVVQLSPPLEVDPTQEMPQPVRSLTELLWNILRDTALQGSELTTPKVEA